jgi:hypothetical protein
LRLSRTTTSRDDGTVEISRVLPQPTAAITPARVTALMLKMDPSLAEAACATLYAGSQQSNMRGSQNANGGLPGRLCGRGTNGKTKRYAGASFFALPIDLRPAASSLSHFKDVLRNNKS